MRVFGHRGAAGLAPENTVASIRRAVAEGVDGVEFDVRMVEGEAIVIHDERLERTTNGRGRVDRQTLAYVRSLDAGGGERVPLLAEAIEAAGERVIVNVELKVQSAVQPAAALIRLLASQRRCSADRFLVSSFNLDALALMRRLAPEVPTAALVTDVPSDLGSLKARLGAVSLHAPIAAVSERLVSECREQNLALHVYTVNEIDEMQRMVEIGVDGVFTDHPERAQLFRTPPPADMRPARRPSATYPGLSRDASE